MPNNRRPGGESQRGHGREQKTHLANGDPWTGKCKRGWCNEQGHKKTSCFFSVNKIRCNEQKCEKPWTHDTKDCPTKQSSNKQQQQSKGQVRCDSCGRDGHKTENCRARKPADVSTTTYTTAATYCKFCNVIDHKSETCENELSFARHQQSKMKCVRCKEKGHSHDMCRNPAGKTCTKCLAPGHERKDCPRKFDKELKTPSSPYRQEFERFFRQETNERSRFFVRDLKMLHETQAWRMRLEEYIHNYELQRKGLDATTKARIEKFIAVSERELEMRERLIFLKSTDPSADVASASVVPLPTIRTAVNVAPADPVPAAGFTSYASQSHLPRFVHHTTQNGTRRSSAWTRRAIENQALRDMQEDSKKILQKINASRSTYRIELYNHVITRNEREILEHRIVTPFRMNELKAAIHQCALIWRDPQAMAALFARKIPICIKCARHGAIADQHFEPIRPDRSAAELYALEDDKHPAWGIFIVFLCKDRCSRLENGLPNYTFVDIDTSQYPGIDWANDPQYRRYGDMF